MNSIQKVIQYLAIAFALFLAVSIISGIGYAFVSIGNIFDSSKESFTDKLEAIEIIEEDMISSLEIDVDSTNITLKTGEVFLVQTNNKYIQVEQESHNLSIQEKEDLWFSRRETPELVIYLPIEFRFQEVSIEVGAGRLEIEEVSTSHLDLNLGAGKVTIDKLVVFDYANIDSGAGEVTIKNSELNNLDLNMGVGKFTLNAKLSGNSKIEHGVGEANLNLIGTLEDYQIHLDKGLGTVTIDKKEIKDDEAIGTGINKIDIDGGIGKIQIHITEETTTSQTFTKTFQLLNISKSDEENSYYLTLQLFQGEVDTILVKDINNQLESGKNYEFTFTTKSKTIEDNIKSIFENSTILSIKETTKVGLEQIQDSIE